MSKKPPLHNVNWDIFGNEIPASEPVRKPLTTYQVRKMADKITQVDKLRRVCQQISMDTLTVKLDIGTVYLEEITKALGISEKQLIADLSCGLAAKLRDRLSTENAILDRMLADPSWDLEEEDE